MLKKLVILHVGILLAFSGQLMASRTTFQNGLNGYTGTEQTQMYNTEGSATQYHGASSTLRAWGVPHLEQNRMFILRFDDIFNPEKGGLTSDLIVTAAYIELYKVGQLASGDWLWNNTTDAEREVRIYSMNTKVNNSNTDGNGYANFTYKNYIDSQNYTYWGNGQSATNGPVSGIDYASTRVGTIHMEEGAGNQWYSIDVTDVINLARAADGTAGNGFLFRAAQNWMGLDFTSAKSTNTEFRPRLVLEYYAVPEPSGITLMGAAGFLFMAIARRRMLSPRYPTKH